MFKLKNLFIILTLLRSVQSLIASVIDEEQWLVKPNKYLIWHGEFLKSGTYIYPPDNSSSLIEKILVAEYEDTSRNKGVSFFITILLRYRSDDPNHELIEPFLNSNFNRERLEAICGPYDWFNDLVCTQKKDFSTFLEIFYEAKIIPDSVLDIIVPKLPMTDFRPDIEIFIRQLNTKLKNDMSCEEVQKIMFQDLDQIKDQKQRDKITWGVIKDLQDSEANHDVSLIKLLCQRIHAPSPSYSEAQKILAQLSIIEHSDKPSVEERYKTPIIKMLETNIPEKNAFIKAFLSNGHPSTDELPIELQDISLSAETIFNLLNYIRKLQNKTSD